MGSSTRGLRSGILCTFGKNLARFFACWLEVQEALQLGIKELDVGEAGSVNYILV